MKKGVKLSIAVTFYNQKNFVDRALESIFSQNLDCSFEVLVGDDGSSDGTVDVIKKWMQIYPDKISLFIMDRRLDESNEPIYRASANRLNLVAHANGEYIAFLDGDDFYSDKNKFSLQLSVLESKENEDCIACAHNVNYYWDNGETKPINDPSFKEQKVGWFLYWTRMYFCSTSFVFRNIFTHKMNFILKDYFDDNLIVFFALQFGLIYYLPATMACYQQSDKSSWGKRSLDEQQLLNAADYDIEKQMVPKFEKASLIRHFLNFKYLYEHRNRIDSKVAEKMLIYAEKANAKETLKWIKYANADPIQKIKTIVSYFWLRFRYEKLLKC